MSAMGLPEFFALEAGEYLDKLDGVAKIDRTPGEEFVRFARALRGAALMASQDGTARAAKTLESMAKAIVEGERPWDENARALAARAIDDLRILVRNAGSWTAQDDQTASALTRALQQFVGVEPSRPAATKDVDSGVREFVGREGELISDALEHASRRLADAPNDFTVVEAAVRSMQPLRGLGGLQDLEPLPSILDGIESVIGDLAAGAVENPSVLFDAAARAVSRAAREIATVGRAQPDSPEAREFASRLGGDAPASPDVLPIEALFHDDDGPHVLEQGQAPTAPSSLSALEMVSHGEHLRQVADDFERAQSATQRELLAHTLSSTLRSLSRASGGALPTAIASFSLAARDSISRKYATEAAAEFAAQLRAAGMIMSQANEQPESRLAGDLRSVAAAVAKLGRPTVRPPRPAPAPRPVQATAAPTSSPGAIAIPDLGAPETPESGDAEAQTGLVGSWSTYVRLVVENARRAPGTIGEFLSEPFLGIAEGVGAVPSEALAEPVGTGVREVPAETPPAPLEEIAVPPPEPEPVAPPEPVMAEPEPVPIADLLLPDQPVETPAPPEAQPATLDVAPPAAPEGVPAAPEPVAARVDDVVPIEAILYQGRAALARARELRAEIGHVRGPRRLELLDELLDVVDLALADRT